MGAGTTRSHPSVRAEIIRRSPAVGCQRSASGKKHISITGDHFVTRVIFCEHYHFHCFLFWRLGGGGWLPRLSLSLKIRAGVRVKLRSPVAARYSELRGVYEARLKGRLSIQNKTQRESTATRRLSPHYGQNERTEKDMRGTCLSSLPVPGGA